ncbi:hypothetical protein [Nocardia sp. NPDC056100]|uniref:hypothetical protein n=1 Tax=Nocardia sp. NPDC056100 TaxID=3345712 RepID=UPI0035DC30CB
MTASTRTTPPRPVDLEAAFPELRPLARIATRLHPRPGVPTPQHSSIGGPLLWPADEPWPHCTEHGHDIEKADVPEGRFAMLPIVQLYLRDVPGLRPPEGADLLQVLWCPFEFHPDGMPTTAVFWRTAAAVTEVLLAPPEATVDDPAYVPEPCLIHPEEVIDYPSSLEFGRETRDRLDRWAIDELGIEYQNLCIAPGFKVGGHINWGMTDPYPNPCPTCGTETEPLLTITGREWSFDIEHWIPYEDQDANTAWGPVQDGPKRPTRICVSDDNAQIIRVCPASREHPHIQMMQ